MAMEKLIRLIISKYPVSLPPGKIIKWFLGPKSTKRHWQSSSVSNVKLDQGLKSSR